MNFSICRARPFGLSWLRISDTTLNVAHVSDAVYAERSRISLPFTEVVRDEVVHGDRIGLRVLLALHEHMLQPMARLAERLGQLHDDIAKDRGTYLYAQEELALYSRDFLGDIGRIRYLQ